MITTSILKDAAPFLIAIPAAWLGYCAQRRSSYLQQLRSLWSKLVDGVHSAMRYTDIVQPTQQEFLVILSKLGCAIDEVRGVFCNLDETGSNTGLYPFEPLKDMYVLIEKLGYGKEFRQGNPKDVCKKILALWKDVRKEFLKEFDREEPTFSHSHWDNIEKCKVYEDHNIPKTPS